MYEKEKPNAYQLEIKARKGLWNYYVVEDWKIISKNSNGSATGCITWSFTTINSNYAECLTNPTYPADASVDIPVKPTLSWPVVPLATKYRIYLGTTPNPPPKMRPTV